MHVRGYRRSAAGTSRRRPRHNEQGGKYLAEEEEDARQALLVFVIPGWAWMWHEAEVWISWMDCMYSLVDSSSTTRYHGRYRIWASLTQPAFLCVTPGKRKIGM
jgi:hypothetical protein